MKRYQMLKTLGLIAAVAVAAQAADTKAALKEVASLDVKKVCDVKANGADKVVAVAEKYNPAAIELQVEFKRLGINNSKYIKAVKEAIAKHKKEVVIHYKAKGKKKTKKFPLDYAAWRSCTFAVRALQQVNEAEKTWRLAVPGDGYKF